MKPSCKKLKAFEKEEAKTKKEYIKDGFKKQGNQEGEHSKFFKKEFERRKCK
jgi:hypothetical protein